MESIKIPIRIYLAISILIFSTLEIHLYSTSIHMLNYCLCKLTKFSRVFFSKLTSPCLLVSLYLIFMWIWRTWGINVDFFFKWTFSCNGRSLQYPHAMRNYFLRNRRNSICWWERHKGYIWMSRHSDSSEPIIFHIHCNSQGTIIFLSMP